LSKETIQLMLTKHKNNWGLGPSLKGDSDSLIFQHGGSNAGFTNDMISFAYQGGAVIIMTNADNGGRLIGEILLSISNYYDWDIRNSKIIEPIEIASKELKNFVGRYKYEDTTVEISVKGQGLFITDIENPVNFTLIPVNATKFIDIEEGIEFVFQYNDNALTGFLFNNLLEFKKIEK